MIFPRLVCSITEGEILKLELMPELENFSSTNLAKKCFVFM